MSASLPVGDAEPSPVDDPPERRIRQAAGIYGLIVTAAVLATAATHLRTGPLVVAVLVTLAVYWIAEEYAQLVEHVSNGHVPSWAHIREGLVEKWPMVSASFVPLVAMLLARLFTTPSGAAYIALGVTVLMLVWYGFSAGRAAGLHGFPLIFLTSVAGSLGLLMVLLKVLISHLH